MNQGAHTKNRYQKEIESLLDILQSKIPSGSRNEIWLDWVMNILISKPIGKRKTHKGLAVLTYEHDHLCIHKQGNAVHLRNTQFKNEDFNLPYEIPQGTFECLERLRN